MLCRVVDCEKGVFRVGENDTSMFCYQHWLEFGKETIIDGVKYSRTFAIKPTPEQEAYINDLIKKHLGENNNEA